jgi:hypothetical protein
MHRILDLARDLMRGIGPRRKIDVDFIDAAILDQRGDAADRFLNRREYLR